VNALISNVPAHEKSWRLPRDWKALDEVKRYLERHHGFCHASCREAAMMASWELAENVVKYGLAGADGIAGTVSLVLGPGKTVIRTENTAQWSGGAHEVVSTIMRLSSATSVRELYLQRLQQLVTGEGLAHTRLGLLRVAYEGAFRLSYRHDAPRLEIVAERRCDPKTVP
jgi:hypothetical protein